MNQKPDIIAKLPRIAREYIAQVELENRLLQSQVKELKDRLLSCRPDKTACNSESRCYNDREMSEQPVSNFYYYDPATIPDPSRRHYVPATEVTCEFNGVEVTLACDRGEGVEVRFSQTGSRGRCVIQPEVSNVIRILPGTRNPSHEPPQTPPQA